jgi:hypothetical protein
MDNPFQRRASEFLRDDAEAFLAIVSPEPVSFFLSEPGAAGRLYDRLVLVRGTPGSGKTTLAKLFEFPTLSTLLRNTSVAIYQALVGALRDCGAINDGQPTVLGCRLPLENDYRDFWEFPYSDGLKMGLMTALLQARAVLAWIRHLEAAGADLTEIEIVPRSGAEVIVSGIGGLRGDQVAARARQVEGALYAVMGALIAPDEAALPPEATGAYQPFDIIESIRVRVGQAGSKQSLVLRPLAILDDAHVLHPTQFAALQRSLARRELRIARWMIARFDVLLPQEALAAVADGRSESASYPGLSQDRETEVVLLQSSGPRRENRSNFRKMAKDMSGRYLKRMPLLSGRSLVVLGDLLADQEVSISESDLKKLSDSVDVAQRRLQITAQRREAFEKEVAAFKRAGKPVAKDVAFAMLAAMFHRHDKRRGQPSMFGDEDPEPARPVTATSSVYEGALLHLLHKFDRPYFYGIDDLCDASSENAEQFLQLASILVETVGTQILKGKDPSLTADTQHRLLRKRGEQIIDLWNFPHYTQVRRLVTGMAERCVEETILPNAWLTPNAFGFLQSEFESLSEKFPDLADVLQFGIAYNAVTLVPHYPQGGKTWCLIELGGMVTLKHGLTLKRGGFIESTVREVAGLIAEKKQ